MAAVQYKRNLKEMDRRRRKPLGRPDGLTDAERARLSKLLMDGELACGFPTELWTLARVGALIEVQFGRVYSTTQVWCVLRSLGFLRQRPAGLAIQRDEAAILQWRNKRWPALKKGAEPKGAPSYSSTSRD